MKRLAILIIVLLSVLPMGAQSYEDFWKETKAALQEDLPQTALQSLRKHREKAVAETHGIELLRALLGEYLCQSLVSPDSATKVLQHLEKALNEEHDDIRKALWQNAIGQIYAQLSPSDTLCQRKMQEHLLASVAHPEILADARTTDYLPLFMKGEDSRIYHHDLLSVLVQNAATHLSSTHSDEILRMYGSMQKIYETRHLTDAVLQTTLDSIDLAHAYTKGFSDGKAIKRLMEVAQVYESLPTNVETYLRLINYAYPSNPQKDSLLWNWAQKGYRLYRKSDRAAALRNYLKNIQRSSLTLEVHSEQVFTHQTLVAHFSAQNVTKVELRLQKLTTDAPSLLKVPYGKKRYEWAARQKKGKVQKIVKHLPAIPPYRSLSDTLHFSFNEPGIYLVELCANGVPMDREIMSCSNVSVLTLHLPDSTCRATLMDTRKGHPIEGCLTLYRQNGQKVKTLFTDSSGNVFIDLHHHRELMAFPSSGTDVYAPSFYTGHPRSSLVNKTKKQLEIFTDRSIYRPGQEVLIGGWVYSQCGDSITMVQKDKITLGLFNAQQKMIDSLTVVTDEYGNFSGRLPLPENALPGTFSLSCHCFGMKKSHYFQVEAYKRPTFIVETNPISSGYHLGDTVILSGKVRSLTGQAIELAQMKWQATPQRHGRSRPIVIQQGTTYTNADGMFFIPVLLDTTHIQGISPYGNIPYSVEMDVTAPHGETMKAQTYIRASIHEWEMTIEVPEVILKEQATPWQVKLYNANHQPQNATGHYQIWHYPSKADSVLFAEAAFTTHRPIRIEPIQQMPSGHYRVKFTIENLNAHQPLYSSRDFHLYSTTDTQLASPEKFLVHTRMSQEGDEAEIMLASTCDSVVLFYDLIAHGTVRESRRLCFSDSILHFPLRYRTEFNEGARLHLTFMKEGKLYTHTTEVIRPRPKKELILAWTSFRSYCQPGNFEKWSLTVKHPDGRPASSSVIARLYDASLDALTNNQWELPNLFFPRNLFTTTLGTIGQSSLYMNGQSPFTPAKTVAQRWSHWKEDLFQTPWNHGGRFKTIVVAAPLHRQYKTMDAMNVASTVGEQEEIHEDEGTDKEVHLTLPNLPLRRDFRETAFFFPHLRCNEEGAVEINFTLPESVTAWQFTALAHTHHMEMGRLDTTIVARKEMMVRPAMPRFLRKGDRTQIPVTLTNFTDETLTLKVSMIVQDASTEKKLYSTSQPQQLAAHSSETIFFEYTATEDTPVLRLRFMAEGKQHSDGEEHYLTVLEDLTPLRRTLPFTLLDTTEHVLRIDTLWKTKGAQHRRLSLEYTGNPTWYAVAALPALTINACHNAQQWAQHYYAQTVGYHIAQQYPALLSYAEQWTHTDDKETGFYDEKAMEETPWWSHADQERRRAQALTTLLNEELAAARKHTALDHLKELQLPNGAWSWFKGMPGNAHTTLEVATLLARLISMTGDPDARHLLQQAMSYLQNESAQRIRRRQQLGHEPFLDEWQIRYLYLKTLTGQPWQSTDTMLYRELRKQKNAFTSLYDKSLATFILLKKGNTTEAQSLIKSLLEHTVQGAHQERFFDSQRAPSSKGSYKIPTHVAAMEALQAGLEPMKETDPHRASLAKQLEEMRLWLLLSKRTQSWDTERATTDAIYLLLGHSPKEGSLLHTLTPSSSLHFALWQGRKIKVSSSHNTPTCENPMDYHRQHYDLESGQPLSVEEKSTLVLQQSHPGLSWGHVTVDMAVPNPVTPQSGKGLHMERRFEVERRGQWILLSTAESLKVGEKVRQVFTLRADADYDFVAVRSARAACFEPVQPISGYYGHIGGGCYRVVHNASTEHFFEQISKGTHTFTEEYFIDRSGCYECGITSVTSVYAPEFCGQTGNFEVKVEPKAPEADANPKK